MFVDKHISSIIKSCFFQLCDFRPIRLFISKTAAITLTNAFVHSGLYFCNSLFYGLPKYSVHCLQKVQNTVAQIVTNSFHSSHITPTFISLHWLPIFYHINFKICCITHRALSLGEPFYLSTLLTHRSNTHSLRTTSFSPLLFPYFTKESNGFSIFSYAAPFHWNHLPDTVCFVSIYMLFRRNLKTYVFNQAFPILTVFPIRYPIWILTAFYSGYPLWTSWLQTSVYWGSWQLVNKKISFIIIIITNLFIFNLYNLLIQSYFQNILAFYGYIDVLYILYFFIT